MQVDTEKYVPFNLGVKLFGKTQAAFANRVRTGAISFIEVWEKTKLYCVDDILKIKNVRVNKYDF